jgi:tight adherence protein C
VPQADSCCAQAQDVRDTAKRELMESAGKKKIEMKVPVVGYYPFLPEVPC